MLANTAPLNSETMPSTNSPTSTVWTHQFDTVRREKLFQNPPEDHSAYPALQEAINPHIESFNALFEKDGLIAQGLLDIGTKVFLDGDERDPPAQRNKLSIRIKEVMVEKSVLPATNKHSTRNREILPAECRERHVTYRGKMLARLEMKVNNQDWKEFIRDIGQLPLMLKVCTVWGREGFADGTSRTDATWKIILQLSWSSGKKKPKNLGVILSLTGLRRLSDCLLSTVETFLWPSFVHRSKEEGQLLQNTECSYDLFDRTRPLRLMCFTISTTETSRSDFPGRRTNILSQS